VSWRVDYLLLTAVDLVPIVVDDLPFKSVDPALFDGDFSGRGGDEGLGAFGVVVEGGRSGDVAGEVLPIGLLVIDGLALPAVGGAPFSYADHGCPEANLFGGGVGEEVCVPSFCMVGLGGGGFGREFWLRGFSVLWGGWIGGDLGRDLLFDGRYLPSDRVDRIGGSLRERRRPRLPRQTRDFRLDGSELIGDGSSGLLSRHPVRDIAPNILELFTKFAHGCDGCDRGFEGDPGGFLSLGADPYLPRGLIESFLRVFKHFALKIPRGKV